MKLRLNILQLKILRSLSSFQYARIKDVARDVNRSPTRVSIAVKDLEDKGFIESEKRGFSKQAAISSNKHSSLLKTFISEHQHMKFEKILSGPTLEILLPLTYSKMRLSEIVKESGYSERTVRRVVKKLREFGIVTTEKFYYSKGSIHKLLYDFVEEFQRYLNLKLALELSSDAVILWERGKEFILKTRQEIKEKEDIFSTCFTKMYDFGIKLILPDYRHYFYTPYKKRLEVEDVALHTLAVDRMSAKNTLYVLLLISKNPDKIDLDYLKKESEKLELEETVHQLFNYLKNRGKPKPTYFPTWKEFKSKAEDYAICLKEKSLEKSI